MRMWVEDGRIHFSENPTCVGWKPWVSKTLGEYTDYYLFGKRYRPIWERHDRSAVVRPATYGTIILLAVKEYP